MMYFHRSTSGKLSDPLPRHCPAQRIMKRGRPVRRIAWERKNLPSAQSTRRSPDKPHGCWVLRPEFTVNVGIALTVNFSQ